MIAIKIIYDNFFCTVFLCTFPRFPFRLPSVLTPRSSRRNFAFVAGEKDIVEYLEGVRATAFRLVRRTSIFRRRLPRLFHVEKLFAMRGSSCANCRDECMRGCLVKIYDFHLSFVETREMIYFFFFGHRKNS